jgi:hypothetical protein
MENVGIRANILLTTPNKKGTALGIERKLSQVHGTPGFYRQPVKQSAVHSQWPQSVDIATSIQQPLRGHTVP